MTAKRKEEEELSYREAMEQVEEILAGIESEEIDIDDLAEKVKKAAGLLKTCKEKIVRTEKEVQKIISEFEEPVKEEDD